MKKIMFSKIARLTESVVEKLKTNTRRSIPERLLSAANNYVQKVHGTGHDFLDYLLEHSPYKVGDVVAVAQSYDEVFDEFATTVYLLDEPVPENLKNFGRESDATLPKTLPGWKNKMYVRADLMPHRIRITNVRVERLQDISDEDCLREGIIEYAPCCECGSELYAFDGADDVWHTPREAFAALFKKLYGKKVWDDNPYVYVYAFELVI